MHATDYSALVSLIPPAVALALLAYFIRLFGKIIADQKPFSDDREWEIELGGIMFMIMLAQGIVGAAAAIYGPLLLSYRWMHSVDFAIVAVLLGLTFWANAALSQRFFLIDGGTLQKNNELFSFFYKLGKHAPISLVPVVLFYAGTVEYLSGSVVWIVLIWALILYTLIVLALIYSLRRMMKQERVGVDIHFVDRSRKPLKNVIILKVNDDNIRLRHGDTVMIINKDQVLKLEMVVPKKYVPNANASGKNLW